MRAGIHRCVGDFRSLDGLADRSRRCSGDRHRISNDKVPTARHDECGQYDNLTKQIRYGVAVFVMLFPVVMLIQWLLSMIVEYDHPVLSVLAENPTFVSIFGCWAAAVLAAPFLEEFLFRGVFQYWLERLSVSKLSNDQLFVGGANVVEEISSEPHEASSESFVTAELVEPNNDDDVADADKVLNPYATPQRSVIRSIDVAATTQRRFAYWPIFVSSLCFALVHLGQGLAPIPLFILAVGLGYLFRQTGSLIACITVHFLLNLRSWLPVAPVEWNRHKRLRTNKVAKPTNRLTRCWQTQQSLLSRFALLVVLT